MIKTVYVCTGVKISHLSLKDERTLNCLFGILEVDERRPKSDLELPFGIGPWISADRGSWRDGRSRTLNCSWDVERWMGGKSDNAALGAEENDQRCFVLLLFVFFFYLFEYCVGFPVSSSLIIFIYATLPAAYAIYWMSYCI